MNRRGRFNEFISDIVSDEIADKIYSRFDELPDYILNDIDNEIFCYNEEENRHTLDSEEANETVTNKIENTCWNCEYLWQNNEYDRGCALKQSSLPKKLTCSNFLREIEHW